MGQYCQSSQWVIVHYEKVQFETCWQESWFMVLCAAKTCSISFMTFFFPFPAVSDHYLIPPLLKPYCSFYQFPDPFTTNVDPKTPVLKLASLFLYYYVWMRAYRKDDSNLTQSLHLFFPKKKLPFKHKTTVTM